MFSTHAQTAETLQGNRTTSDRRSAPAENPRIEIVFEGEADGAQLAIKYLTWTEGLGWCCQKTIRVEAEQLDELHRAVTVARHRVNRRRAEIGLPAQTAQVIRLPTLA
jgi:hypothetical protein